MGLPASARLMQLVPPKVDRIEVYESASLLVLLGQPRSSQRWRLCRFYRGRADGESLTLTEESEEYEHTAALERLAALSTREAPLVFSFHAVALLGVIHRPLSHPALSLARGHTVDNSHPPILLIPPVSSQPETPAHKRTQLHAPRQSRADSGATPATSPSSLVSPLLSWVFSFRRGALP